MYVVQGKVIYLQVSVSLFRGQGQSMNHLIRPQTITHLIPRTITHLIPRTMTHLIQPHPMSHLNQPSLLQDHEPPGLTSRAWATWPEPPGPGNIFTDVCQSVQGSRAVHEPSDQTITHLIPRTMTHLTQPHPMSHLNQPSLLLDHEPPGLTPQSMSHLTWPPWTMSQLAWPPHPPALASLELSHTKRSSIIVSACGSFLNIRILLISMVAGFCTF